MGEPSVKSNAPAGTQAGTPTATPAGTHAPESTRTALLLSFLERYTTVSVYAVSNVVLSRLLTPHDTGLFTLGFALTVMIGTLRDFGVGTYIIQEPTLTDVKWRTALGVSGLTCAVVLAAVVVASFVAGHVYADPDVTKVMLISGLTLTMIPFSALVLAYLRREMRYGVLYRIALLGAVGQSIVTMVLAWYGEGAMSMAWGSVANSVVVVIGSIGHRPRQFGYRPTLAAWRPIAGLGVYSTIGTVCHEVTPNGSDVFLGRFAGLAALGQFSKGGSLVTFVNQALINAALPVALSVFAQRRRAGEPLNDAFLRALTLLSGITWPAFAGLAVVAAPVIRLLFGSQWEMAIPPSRLIVVAAMITSLTALHATVYQAFGAMRARMLVQVAVTPAQLLVLFVAAHGTLTQMALGVIASAAIEFVPSQFMVNRICGTAMRNVGGALLPSAVVAACTVTGALAAASIVPSSREHIILPLGLALAFGAIGWLIGLAVSRHPLSSEVIKLVHAIRRRTTRRSPC